MAAESIPRKMNILIVANHWAICSARYMTDAFKRAGHDVKHIGPARGRSIWGLTLPPEYEWTPDDPLELMSSMKADWASVVIVMDSDPALLDGVGQAIRHQNMVVYGVDNHVRAYRRPWFLHYFLAHKHGPTQPVTEADESWLPVAYDPVHFTPSPIPFDDRAFDVILLGVMYPDRVQAVNDLRAAGFKVLAGTGLVYEAYAKAHHNARIALCLSPFGDLSQRWFESAAMGCHVLGNIPDDLTDAKANGALGLHGFSTYQPEAGESIVERVRELLDDEREKCKASTLNMQEAVKRHTWDARAQEIVKWVEGR